MIIGVSGKIGSGKDTVGKVIQYLTAVDKISKTERLKDIVLEPFEECITRAWNLEAISTWEVKKFAAKLKQIVSILTGIPAERLEDQRVKDMELGREWDYANPFKYSDKVVPQSSINHNHTKYTVRSFLQKLGTEAVRDVIHPDAWVNALFVDYDEGLNPTSHTTLKSANKDQSDNWIITDVRFPNEVKAIKERGGIMIRVNRELEQKSSHVSETLLDDYSFDYVIENNGTLEELVLKVKEVLEKSNLIKPINKTECQNS